MPVFKTMNEMDVDELLDRAARKEREAEILARNCFIGFAEHAKKQATLAFNQALKIVGAE